VSANVLQLVAVVVSYYQAYTNIDKKINKKITYRKKARNPLLPQTAVVGSTSFKHCISIPKI
jgi:hypothetical protein